MGVLEYIICAGIHYFIFWWYLLSSIYSTVRSLQLGFLTPLCRDCLQRLWRDVRCETVQYATTAGEISPVRFSVARQNLTQSMQWAGDILSGESPEWIAIGYILSFWNLPFWLALGNTCDSIFPRRFSFGFVAINDVFFFAHEQMPEQSCQAEPRGQHLI